MWSGVTSIKRSLLQWHWEHPWWQPVQHDYIKLPQTPQNLVDTQWTHEQYASREGTECAGSTRPADHRLSVGNHLLGVVCQNSMVRCELRAVPPGMLTAVFVVQVLIIIIIKRIDQMFKGEELEWRHESAICKIGMRILQHRGTFCKPRMIMSSEHIFSV